MSKPRNAGKEQVAKFRKAARELGTDLDHKKFDAALRKIAKANPDPKDIEATAEMLGQTESKNFGKKR